MKSGEKSLARTTLLRKLFSFFFPVLNGLQFARRGKRGNGGAKVSMLGMLGWRHSYTVDALHLDPLI